MTEHQINAIADQCIFAASAGLMGHPLDVASDFLSVAGMWTEANKNAVHQRLYAIRHTQQFEIPKPPTALKPALPLQRQQPL